jgi:prevent-host-death family protein
METAVGLFEAKTHLSEYVARAERGEEVIITRHNKPVAKIVPLSARPAAPAGSTPPFIQRTFNMGVPLVDLTKANQLAAELEDEELIAKMRRIEDEYLKRHADS